MLSRKGFSLLEMSVVLLLASLMAAITLRMDQKNPIACHEATVGQIRMIEAAMTTYVKANNRYPMPAPRNAGVEDVSHGREAKNQQQIAALKTKDGVTYGALPFQELGLPTSYASDCWGRKFTYAVTTALTDTAAYNRVTNVDQGTTAVKGSIILKSTANTTLNSEVAYAVISHGADGVGAVAKNYRGADSKWCAKDNALQSENCDASNNVLVASQLNDGKDSANQAFDDIVAFHGKHNRRVDGGWSTWSSCTPACESSCEQTRACNSPSPIDGGNNCEGPSTNTIYGGACPPPPAQNGQSDKGDDGNSNGKGGDGNGKGDDGNSDGNSGNGGGGNSGNNGYGGGGGGGGGSSGGNNSGNNGNTGNNGNGGDTSGQGASCAPYGPALCRVDGAQRTVSVNFASWTVTSGSKGAGGYASNGATAVINDISAFGYKVTAWTPLTVRCNNGSWSITSSSGNCYLETDRGNQSPDSFVTCTYSGRVYWDSCSGDATASIHAGESRTVYNSAPGHTGSVTYSCNHAGAWVQSNANCN